MNRQAPDRGQLNDFAPGEAVTFGAFADQHYSEDWINVDVPGDVHQALVV